MNVPARSLHHLVWPVFLVLALLLLGAGNQVLYGIAVPVAALALVLVVPGTRARWALHVDRLDLAVVAGLYLGVVALFWLAFRGFTQQNTLGLFLSFAAGMLLGVVGPVVYTTWIRGRSLSELGFRRDDLGRTLALGAGLAAVQFALTLWGYDLPQPVDWAPLLALSLTVGFFEVVFFRGFVQNRLEAGFGSVAGIGAAAILYAAYHVGYGMGASEMLFLFGLGVVYAVAFALVRSVLVLWPLLVPLGSFYNNLQGGEITMPWAAILGFAEVLALMLATVWLAARHERRRQQKTPTRGPGSRPGRRGTPG
ncbi:CPBP family intramembrane glutamic endopeptidase [uncultured Kocuria sp.]|uniref:CPBP family intramembrane glutamic endopeptidase n=1 Tax=uncultured Kocuria sp. TaxID=259305 RepID=UPI0026167B27|nr:type II CAAX endopeptidase family protein [uncultured Kocuria sp.]